MDTIGPINSDHQIIEANDNYNYVLVIIDAFSRFIQAIGISGGTPRLNM